ncbi:MAG: hypothetical protein QOJ91_2278 [Sphingomonadales bacterium]|jgi:hypothetical protein|nr:hypothetical protein [Sphingomonadales bacterium]
MKKTLVILLLLAGCGRGGALADNQATAESGGGTAARPAPSSPAAEPAVRLAGLYEGGSGAQKNQMCIVEKGGGAQFGMLVWGGSLSSCSGAGKAVRKGDRLTLTMTGDETCTIEASLKDGIVTLPAKLPLGCEYYCGAHASFAGGRFSRVGGDVKKATDIAGDPLCD